MTARDWRPAVDGLLERRHWRAARDLLLAQLRANPRLGGAWYRLAQALDGMGDRAGAHAALERASLLDPQATSLLTRLATPPEDSAIAPWLASLLAVPRVRVVGAVIARDEETHLDRCLSALIPAVDGVVVVDTGSQDHTPDIARSHGATVVTFPWSDDFARARNAAFPALGSEGWVLWVDADEFLLPEDTDNVRIAAALYDRAEPPALLRVPILHRGGGTVSTTYDVTRMHPLGRGIRWQGRIHEQLVPADPGALWQRPVVRVRLNHVGYRPEIVRARNKIERNLRLLRAWTHDEPTNPAAWGFLGRDLLVTGDVEGAADALERAETLASTTPTYARVTEVRIARVQALIRLGRLEEAAAVAQRATRDDPEHPAAWYWRAAVAVLRAEALAREARAWARLAQERAPTYRGLVSVDPEDVRFLALGAEADALKLLGKWDTAVDLYMQALHRRPEHEGLRKQVEAIRTQAERVADRSADPRLPTGE